MPDPAAEDLATVREHLSTRWLGRPHEHFSELDSTNDRAAIWARNGAPHGAMVTADEQTAGRGRRGRSWHSSRLGLATSLILRPPITAEQLPALSLAVGLGLARGLDMPAVSLKWPNDLLLGGRKLGGILCETRWAGHDVEAIVGFGLNVHQPTFDPSLATIATSLALHGSAQPRAHLLVQLLHGLEPVLDRFFAGGFAEIRHDYLRHCPWIGGAVSIEDRERPGVRRPVIALDINPSGELVVDDDGRQCHVRAGEVWLPST